MAQMKKPLSVYPEGKWTVIEARPSPHPKRTVVISILIGVLIWWPTALLSRSLAFSLVVSGGVSGGLIWLGRRAADGKRGRQVQPGPFAVKRDAVRLPDGTVLTVDRIYAFAILNTQNPQLYLPVGTTSVERGSAMLAASTHQRMLRISWAVVVEHDGIRSTLAGGLREELANAVMHEITRRVDDLGQAR